MRILICDDIKDEALHTERIIKEQHLADGAKISVASPDEAMLMVKSQQYDYDISILDIEYHRDDFNGVDLGREINKVNPYCSVIYLTEIPDYATDVYETMHCYFVIKKNQDVTLSRAMTKAVRLLNSRNKKIRITEKWLTKDILTDKIIYITRRGRRLCIVEDEVHEVYVNMRDILQQLPAQFARCHGGYIVNLDYVDSIGASSLTLKTGSTVPIGRQFKSEFYVKYAEYLGERT